MYDVLTSQFNEALTREGNTVTDSTGTTSYKCLFRKNSDKNSSDNRLNIFYPVSESIEQGQLLKYKSNYFLALNQETDENDTYYKSDLLQVNTSIHTIVVADASNNTAYELFLQAYAEDLSSVGLYGDSQISIVGGNISFIVQDNADSRKLKIDATFTALGGTWKIVNLYFKSGLGYVFTERTADAISSPVYAVTVIGSDSVTMEDVAQLVATATITDGSTTTTILNPVIDWSCDNTSLATVSSTGLIAGVDEGNIVITASWAGHGVSATHNMEVKSNVVISYTAAITGRSSIVTGRSYTFSAIFTDSTGTVVTLTPVWSFTMDTQDATLLAGITLTYPASNTCKVSVADNDDLVGYTVTLHVKDSNDLCEATYDIVLE
jgi:hypothetical protein